MTATFHIQKKKFQNNKQRKIMLRASRRRMTIERRKGEIYIILFVKSFLSLLPFVAENLE
jgi:hypothetical protein